MKLFTRTHQMGAAALIMAASVFASRFMGLLRDKVISYLFGATAEADIYFAAFVVPDFINYLLAGGYFSITLIPLLSERFERDPGSSTARRKAFRPPAAPQVSTTSSAVRSTPCSEERCAASLARAHG